MHCIALWGYFVYFLSDVAGALHPPTWLFTNPLPVKHPITIQDGDIEKPGLAGGRSVSKKTLALQSKSGVIHPKQAMASIYGAANLEFAIIMI